MYLLIVTGMSGAGKTAALKALEAMGYYCMDNLPGRLLSEYEKLLLQAHPPVEKAAVTVDGREMRLYDGSLDILTQINKLQSTAQVLFLDSSDKVLLARYNELRRAHPQGEGGEPDSGIRAERQYLQPLRARADYVLDTSNIPVRQLSKRLQSLLPQSESLHTKLSLCSFGYKRGLPMDADMVFDMRFSENPYYVPELKELSGMDKPVADFVKAQPYVEEYLSKVTELIKSTLPLFEQQEKGILHVAFGCTGGRHRSVYAAERCGQLLKQAGIPFRLYHRDYEQELQQILDRGKKE